MGVETGSLEGRTLFIGIGAQKSGTTWLFANLEQHPEVFMAPCKERHWFDKPPTRMGQGHYLDYFRARIRGERVFGEITPAYATLEASHFVEMLNLHPDVRLLFVIRDPVARVWSGLRMRARGTGVPATSLLDRIGYEGMVLRTRYDRTILEVERALDLCGRPASTSFLTVFFEDLPQPSTLEGIHRFLGVTPMPAAVEGPVFEGPPETLPEDAARRIRELYAPVYEFVRMRFGEAAPASWSW